MKLMPDCDENMVLRYVMPKKNSRHEYNWWCHRCFLSTSWILMA